MRSLLLLPPLLLLMTVSLAATDSPQTDTGPRKRVVCFGDSITKAGYPKHLAQQLEGAATVSNAGVNGNTTRMALRRMDKDVLAAHPDVVVVFFGTNDMRLAEPKVHVPLDQYRANLQQMIDAVTHAGGKVVLCTPPPIDPQPYFTRHARAPFTAAGGLEKVLADYRQAVLTVADQNKTPVVDLNHLLSKDLSWRSPDGVHPTEKGSQLIAHHIAHTLHPLLQPTTPTP